VAGRVSLPPRVDGQGVFCAIARGSQPASIVADEGEVLAFCDIQPVAPGHLLVVPREHVEGLADLLDADGKDMFALAQRLARAVRRVVRCDGVNLFLADGAAAGQEIPHVHLHVVPRTVRDGVFRISANWSLPARAELDATAARIRSVLI
jgi:diadenosine tetraphosphate (Ap4A) HIT family hydrolase